MALKFAKFRVLTREFELITGHSHPRSSISVSIESVCDFVLVISNFVRVS